MKSHECHGHFIWLVDNKRQNCSGKLNTQDSLVCALLGSRSTAYHLTNDCISKSGILNQVMVGGAILRNCQWQN